MGFAGQHWQDHWRTAYGAEVESPGTPSVTSSICIKRLQRHVNCLIALPLLRARLGQLEFVGVAELL